MRATRDLLRRRLFFARKRGELLAHIQNTNTQYNLPPLDERAGKTKDRGAIIEHFDNDTVGQQARQRIAGIGHPLPLRFFIRITEGRE
jgi:hypothetical protein